MLKGAQILFLALVVMGCQRQAAPKDAAPLPVRIAYTTQHDCALVHLAMVKGFFSQEGLAVQPLLCSFGKEALATLLEGKSDLATVAETPLMFAVLKGEKVAVIASIFSSGKNNAIVANRDRGISLPGDLRGKRIAVTPGTTTELFLDSFLAANSLSRRDVTTVSLDPDDMLGALMTGQVDAASARNPYMKTIGRRLGVKGAVYFDPDLYTETYVMAGRPEYLKGHPELVRRVLRALLRAEEFARDHAPEAQALVASALQMDCESLRECWNDSRFRVSLDQSLLIALEDETRWAIRNRLAFGARMPNYMDYISFDGLGAVKPDAIGIKR
jgi:ABC-type nitrate/sulfonate/bicarbonate transport system substrate-binding protein